MNSFLLSWGTDGFFSYAISLHPDYVLYKLGHIVLYGALGLCLYQATGRSLRSTLIIVAIFAASDEWHQSFVPDRSGRFFDVLIDVAAAWSAVWLLKNRQKRRNKRAMVQNSRILDPMNG